MPLLLGDAFRVVWCQATENVLVKRLGMVDTLGCVDLIASDKVRHTVFRKSI
jgi:hypothetical protein